MFKQFKFISILDFINSKEKKKEIVYYLFLIDCIS